MKQCEIVCGGVYERDPGWPYVRLVIWITDTVIYKDYERTTGEHARIGFCTLKSFASWASARVQDEVCGDANLTEEGS